MKLKKNGEIDKRSTANNVFGDLFICLYSAYKTSRPKKTEKTTKGGKSGGGLLGLVKGLFK